MTLLKPIASEERMARVERDIGDMLKRAAKIRRAARDDIREGATRAAAARIETTVGFASRIVRG